MARAGVALLAVLAFSSSAAAQSEPVADQGGPDEVKIRGTRAKPNASPTEHKIGREEMKVIPGAFGDPYRAIDMLPGVVPTVSGLPYYYVRGAPPSAVGYFIDEIRVPFLFHFALGPGVIQPALVDEVTLHPAAYPGRYGRYAGAIVAGKTREPPATLSGEGQLRIYDAGLYVESPFANGRATAGVGGRFSYTAALLSLVTPDTTLAYRDYNARVSYDLSDRWRLSALAIGSYDYAAETRRDPPPEHEEVFFASEFHRLDLRLDRQGENGATTRIATTFGLDRSRLEGSRFAQDFLFGARARHGAPLHRDVDIEVGLDTTIDHISGDLPSLYAVGQQELENTKAFFEPRTDTATGAWVSGSWHPSRGFELTATARADVFTSKGEVGVGPSPRVSMRVPLPSRGGPKIVFLGALGIAPQPPAFAIPIPAVGYSGLPGGVGFGYQKSAGAEIELPWKFTARAVGFHHSYFNLRDFSRTSSDIDLEKPVPVPSSPTQAYGAELFVHRKLTEKVGAFLSYTLSRSEIGATETTPKRISPFDRTHVLQIGGAVYLGAGFRTSARFLTYRGWPDQGSDPNALVANGRLRPFFRVDARIEKRWQWRQTGYIALVLEALNASASKEVVKRVCDPDCRDETIGPIVAPSLGVEGML